MGHALCVEDEPSSALNRDLHMDGVSYTRCGMGQTALRLPELHSAYCVIVVRGGLDVKVEFPDPQVIHLKQGDVLSISGLANHLFSNPSAPPCRTPGVFQARPMTDAIPEDISLIVGSIENEALALASWVMGPIVIRAEEHAVLSRGTRAAVAMIEHEYAQGLPDSDLVLRRLSEILMINFARKRLLDRGTPQAPPFVKAEQQLMHALAAFLNSSSERWDLNRLASVAGMSRTRFVEQFKNLTGWTPGKLVSRLRFAEARRRMLTEALCIEEAADLAGYSSSSAFVRAFQKEHGETPARWRRRNARRLKPSKPGRALALSIAAKNDTELWE